MPDPTQNPHALPLMQPGEDNIVHIPFMFQTDAGGAPSLDYDYDGSLTITRPSGNNYRLNLGDTFRGCLFVYTNPSPAGYTITVDPANGYVQLNYTSAIASNRYHGLLVIDAGQR